jgi:hypothetical protein
VTKYLVVHYMNVLILNCNPQGYFDGVSKSRLEVVAVD